MSIALTFNNLTTAVALAILKAANTEGVQPLPAATPATPAAKTSAPAPAPTAAKAPPPKPAAAAPPPKKKTPPAEEEAEEEETEEEEAEEEEEAPSPKKSKKKDAEDEVDPKLISAKKLKDVLAILMDQGITDVDDLKAECTRLKDIVPVLGRIENIDVRVDRTLEVMDMGDDA